MPCESFGGGVSTHIYRIRKNFQISQLWCIIRVSKNQVCRAHFGRSQKLRQAGGEGRAPSEAWGRFAPIPSFQEIPGIGKGQGRWGNMGARPHTPDAWDDKRGSTEINFVRRAHHVRTCALWQASWRLRERRRQLSQSCHSGIACGTDKLRRLII